MLSWHMFDTIVACFIEILSNFIAISGDCKYEHWMAVANIGTQWHNTVDQVGLRIIRHRAYCMPISSQ